METFLQDLRFGARTLARNPGFACIAVLTLALGVGANAAIFSVVNAVLLRPLPWHEPDNAVMIWSRWTAFDKTWVSDGEVNDYRKEARTLAEVGAWGEGQVNLTGDGEPERVAYATVTANLFSVLGVTPIKGRTFTPAEDVPNGPRVVILGYGVWQRRYAGDPSIVGRTVQIDGNATRSSASCRRISCCRPTSTTRRPARCGCPRGGTLPAPITAATVTTPPRG